jgi:hypothetical protein
MLRYPSVEELEWLVSVMRAVRLAIDCEDLWPSPHQPGVLQPFSQARTVLGPNGEGVHVQLQYPPAADYYLYSSDSLGSQSLRSCSSDLPNKAAGSSDQYSNPQQAQQAQHSQQQQQLISCPAPAMSSCQAGFDPAYLAVLDAMVDSMVASNMTSARPAESMFDNGDMLGAECSAVSVAAC